MTIEQLIKAKNHFSALVMKHFDSEFDHDEIALALIDAEIERQKPVVPKFRYESVRTKATIGFCECGARLSQYEKYCWNCGKRLEWPELSDDPAKAWEEYEGIS